MAAKSTTTKSPTAELVEEHAEEVRVKASKAEKCSLEVEIGSNGKVETKTLTFKPLTLVPLGILRRTRRDQSEQMWAIFEWALDPEELDILDQVSSDKLTELLMAMQTISVTELGES